MKAPVLRVLSGLAAALMLGACAGPPYPEGSIDRLFPAQPRPQSAYYSVGERRIHYVEMQGNPAARILFIHGTPGSWEGWAHYLADPELRAQATLIAVDRPGFGDSGAGDTAPDLGEQARLLEPLLRGPGGPTVVVGHSLGGPIAARMAMDFPDEVRAAVLVAPSIDPATESPRWYNEVMTWQLVRWIMPAEFSWSNREILPLASELKQMLPRWRTLTSPVTVIQGAKDQLVDPRTADFAARVLPGGDTVIRVPGQGHFVLWKKPQVVIDAILNVLESSTAKAVQTATQS